MSGIGGDGSKEASYCVQSDGTGFDWDVCSEDGLSVDSKEECYWSPFSTYCALDETFPNCCLKRSKSSTTTLQTAAALGEVMYKYDNFRNWQQYIFKWHTRCHNLLASVDIAHMIKFSIHSTYYGLVVLNHIQ